MKKEELKMNTKRMITAIAVLAIAMAVFSFIPAEEISAADENEVVYMHGEVTSTFMVTADQTVIVDGDTVITANGTSSGNVQIEGCLIVNDGVTVTIEAGCMQIGGDAVINGSIVSKAAGGLIIAISGDEIVTVNGTVSALGNTTGIISTTAEIHVESGAEVIVNGAFIIGTNARATFEGQFTVEEKGQFLVYGNAEGTIYLAGYALFDGSAVLDVYLVRTSAAIDVKALSGMVRIFDKGMYAYTCGGESTMWI